MERRGASWIKLEYIGSQAKFNWRRYSMWQLHRRVHVWLVLALRSYWILFSTNISSFTFYCRNVIGARGNTPDHKVRTTGDDIRCGSCTGGCTSGSFWRCARIESFPPLTFLGPFLNTVFATKVSYFCLKSRVHCWANNFFPIPSLLVFLSSLPLALRSHRVRGVRAWAR